MVGCSGYRVISCGARMWGLWSMTKLKLAPVDYIIMAICIAGIFMAWRMDRYGVGKMSAEEICDLARPMPDCKLDYLRKILP